MKCFDPQTLAAHLDGELTLNQSQAAEGHLKTCSVCQTQLERLRHMVAALPSAMSSKDDAAFTHQVMAKLRPVAPRRWTWVAGFAAVATVLLVGILVPQHVFYSRASEFTARGSEGLRKARFTAFLHPASAPGVRHAVEALQVVQAGDGFSFEVQNSTGKPLFVALFAFDSKNETHWFYPSLTTDGDDPSAVMIPAQPTLFALPEGITPEAVAPGELKLVGLFLNEPIRISQVETLLREGQLDILAQKFPDQMTVLNVVQEKSP